MIERDEKNRFVKGNKGGPGKPKGSISLVSILKRKLAVIDPDSKRTYAEIFMDQVLADAATTDGPSRKLVMQYVEGMPQQTVETTHILPEPLMKLNEVYTDNSNEEDSQDDQENKSLAGGNSSQQDNINADLLNSGSTD